MAGQLAARVRAQYPDAYTDLSDQELEALVTAKFPGVYDDLLGGDEAPASETTAPPRRYSGKQPNETVEAFGARMADEMSGLMLPGVTSVASKVAMGPIKALLGRMAPNLMRNAMGAQQAVRSKFPTVDLDAVALREGAVPGSPTSIAAVGASAKAAARAVNDAAAQAGGTVTRRQLIGSLRPLAEQAAKASDDDAMQAVVQRMRQIGREIPDDGLSMTQAQARKQLLAQRGRAARTAATPKDAAFGPQLADAERKALAAAQRSAGMGPALDRSQELMALERAMTRTGQRTSLLRDALGAAAGTAAGLATGNPLTAMVTAPLAVAANRAVTSPRVLSQLAQILHRSGNAPTSGTGQALLAQLLNGATNEPR